eukprot:1755039-Prymnesium_polylepis.1
MRRVRSLSRRSFCAVADAWDLQRPHAGTGGARVVMIQPWAMAVSRPDARGVAASLRRPGR